MDIMDIQAVESKLSDVTVTPIPRSQVQNFYNYQQREQREQQPQIQISAIHHAPRERNSFNERNVEHSSLSTGGGNNGGRGDIYSIKRDRDYHQTQQQQMSTSTAAATVAALQYTQQLQAQLALLQQQSNTTASPTIVSPPQSNRNVTSTNGGSISTQSQLKYPQSTSPLLITTQTSANVTTPLTSTSSLPTTIGNTNASNNGLGKYGQLLAVIEEMGRDIRPTYTGSRSSTERLKRGIVHARILVRECLMETERAARQ